MDDQELADLVAHTFSAYQIALAEQKRAEQRAQTRQRVARHRMSKPTTLPTHGDAPQRELRRA